MSIARLLALSSVALLARAYDNSRYDNLAVYWGQNSYGATHSSDTANWQKRLSAYCQDDTINVIPVAFVTTFFGAGGDPVLNLANTCNNVDNATFPGTNLPDCSALAADVATCQAKGKIVTVSLGGAGTTNNFANDSQAEAFADTLWNLFLGGSSSTRPLGSAVLDGVDIDIETTSPGAELTPFVNRLRTHFTSASKTYYMSAAPQCPYPDANIGTVLNQAWFDFIMVQFYNNQCGLNNYGTVSDWDFGLWDYWASNVAVNKNVKVYLAAPASSTAAGSGYVDAATLTAIGKATRNSFYHYGGIALWDASQAVANGNYQQAIKSGLTAAGGTGFTYPACVAAYKSGTAYTQGQEASYQGYNWQAKWWTQSVPTANFNADWMPISSCSGSSSTVSSTTSAPSTSATIAPNNATQCANIGAWSSSTVYTSGQQVTYNNALWTAKWWTEGDTPGGSAGAWTDNGVCAVSATAKRAYQTPAAAVQKKRAAQPWEERDETSYWRTGAGRRAGMARLFT